MDWIVWGCAIVVVPLGIWAYRADGWSSWLLWALAVFSASQVLVWLWLNLVWRVLLFWLRDYF